MAINIVLYQPEIPPNTGNISRTCALTGCRLHLIKPLGFSIDDRALKRAGLDYWHMLDVKVHESLEDFLNFKGEAPIFFSSTKAEKLHTEVTYTDGCYIMFGKETSGLPEAIYETQKSQLVRIPMLKNPDARSLNLSNSAAIMIYEALRQLDFPGLR